VKMTAEGAGGRALRDARQELAYYEPADGKSRLGSRPAHAPRSTRRPGN